MTHQVKRYFDSMASSQLIPCVITIAVLLIGLSISSVLWRYSQQDQTDHLRTEFENVTDQVASNILNRLDAFEMVMRGVKGYIDGSENVTIEEFGTYVKALQISEKTSGVLGVGLVTIVPNVNKAKHISEIRKSGLVNYSIKPEGARESYAPIIRMEPMTGDNLKALGLDTLTIPLARAAMERARDTGDVAITGHFTLVQDEGKQNMFAFVMYLPIFKGGLELNTLSARRSAIIGWVDVPFRIKDIMAGLNDEFAQDIDLEIHDGVVLSDQSRMYHSDDTFSNARIAEGMLQTQRQLDIAGSSWTLLANTTPAFAARVSEPNRPTIIAWVGCTLSFTFALLAWILARGRQEAKHKYKNLFKQAGEGVLMIRRDHQLIDANPAALTMFGYTREEFLKLSVPSLLTHVELDRLNSTVQNLMAGNPHSAEWLVARKDGTEFVVAADARKLDRQSYFAVLRDQTAFKKAEQRILQLNNIYKALSETNQAIVRMTDESELFPLVCRCAVKFGGMQMAWIGQLDESSALILPIASYGDNLEYLEGLNISAKAVSQAGCEPTEAGVRENRAVIINNFQEYDTLLPWHAKAKQFGWNAAAAFPISRNGKQFAMFFVYSANQDPFDKEVVDLLNEMALDISFALDNFEREKQRQLAQDKLRLTKAALEESRDRYMDLYEFAPVGYFSISNQGLITQVNWKLTSIFGLERNQLNKHPFAELVAAEEKERWSLLFTEMLQQNGGQELNFDMKFAHNTGSILIANLNCLRMQDINGQPILRVALIDVTDLHLAEEARHEVDLNLQATINAIPDLLFELDLNGRYHAAHTPYTHLLSAPTEELIGRTVAEVLPAEAAAVVMSALNEANQFGRSQGLQFDLQLPQGVVWFELSVSKKSSYNNESPRFIVLSRDITIRKQAEAALQSSESHLRTIINNEPECIKIVDALGRLREMNPAGLAMIEADSLEQVVGQSLIDLVAPEYHAAFAALHKRVIAGESGQLEFQGIGLKGRRCWLETHAVPMLENGERVLLGITRDVTERKHAAEALRKSDQHFRAYFERSMVGMAETSPEKGWVEINDRLCEILGYTKQALANMTWAEITHPDDLASDLVEFNRVLSGETNEYTRDKRFIHFDGHVVYTHIAVRCVRLDDGTIDYFVALIDDISERKLAEGDLRIAAIAFESQQGMVITDANKVILRVNRAFTVISGYSAEESIGQMPRLINLDNHTEDFYTSMWASINESGGWEGEVWNRRKNGEVYPQQLSITAVKNSVGIVTNYVAALTDVTESKAAIEKIHNLAFFDSLTGLPNRRLLLDRLNRSLVASARSGQQGALLFLDLDYFKTLNDTRGHATGDLLLKQVAERLKNCVRESDTVARLGGDEFVVLLEDLNVHAIDAAAQAEAVAAKILASLNQPYLLDTYEHRSTASIGIVIFNHDDQSNEALQEDLLKHSDIAMYHAKQTGRNTLRFFDPQMQEAINSRASLEIDLRKAIDNSEFQLYYQIQVDNLGHPLGAETLIRWLHPLRGLVLPHYFISLAEETGLILPIGQWVLDSACAQLKAWQQSTITANLTLSINVSAKQFYQSDFAAQVQVALQRHQIDPKLLKLELTESMLLEHMQDTIITMSKLRELGIRFSLDDFGTGYSSLQYLKLLPLYQLKIDQSFVRDIAVDSSDQAIVRTVIAIAQTLNLDVIAEGVETDVQREHLLSFGCNAFQGYLFGKPMTLEQFEESLKS